MKIRPMGAELIHADGRTDVEKDITKLYLIVAIRKILRTRLKTVSE